MKILEYIGAYSDMSLKKKAKVAFLTVAIILAFDFIVPVSWEILRSIFFRISMFVCVYQAVAMFLQIQKNE